MNFVRLLLTIGACVPVLYFGVVYFFGALYPGFDHVLQPASDLGARDAPYAYAGYFNAGLIVVALSMICGGVGLFLERLSIIRNRKGDSLLV